VRRIAFAVAIGAVLIAGPAGARKRPAPAAVETVSAGGLIDNVNGYTLSRDGKVTRFTGLLIKDGKVVRLLDAAAKRPERLDFRLDGAGRTLLPGLIDSHGHVLDLGLRAMRLDLSGARSLAEAQKIIADYAADHPSPRWIVGAGWNQESWGLGRFPTAADIDRAVADRPVWLERVDGHAAVANTLAMKEAGITAATPVPASGRMEMAGGRPTGAFIDAAQALVGASVPPPLPRELDTALGKAQDVLLAHGITAIADMGTTADAWNTFRRAGDVGRLRVRIISYAAGIDPMISIAGTGPTPWLYGDRLRMVGVKLYGDGALGSRGAWLKADYADAPGQRGLPFLDDAKIRNLMSRAAMDGLQVAIHAIGDAANAQVLDAIAELAETYKGDRRWRIEHAQVVDPADIPRFGGFGTIASMQPVHYVSDLAMAKARLGPARLAGAYAWASIAATGAPLVFGSDVPVEAPDVMAGIAAAAGRDDGALPAERVPVERALAAYTVTGAYAAFAEDRLGTLEPGRDADFVLLDRDILKAAPAEIAGAKVLETWIGGSRAWTATQQK